MGVINMRRIIFLIGVLLLLVGCGETSETTIETDEGDVNVKSSVKNADEWCQVGSEWSMDGGDGSAKMVVEELVSSGKYNGFCHVTYDVSSEEGTANIDFYFNEKGDGYQVMEMNGQKFESEWTAAEE